MSTMNISLPNSLKSFVDEQVSERGYGTSSEYVRELIRKDQDRQRLRGVLLAGAATASASPANATYFEGLRDRVRRAGKPASRG
ncbi:addiction module antitoxin [Thauera propionica]|jgi:antitoxin ParD1/3/4|uniref:Addiction module antitoxin n=1 Tax=Thauera propionica TaxID=2019431 RepID=A0A235EX16_9RHOO|nr:addiction module antitoxin [Thauera propionica]OYD53097.1 addiction module antitoxin [Thauera propionica]